MKLKDTGLTAQDIKDKVNKYMIETYERFDFLAETAKDMYLYDENKTPYLDFYAGIAVNNAGSCNEKVVAAVAVAVVMELALVALDRQIIQQLCFRLDTPNFTWTL